MATKTISLRLNAYERLRRARLHPGESFTEVVLRGGHELGRATEGQVDRGLILETTFLVDLEREAAWIAATALANVLPLVTRNVDEFRRVPDLEVVRYQERSDASRP